MSDDDQSTVDPSGEHGGVSGTDPGAGDGGDASGGHGEGENGADEDAVDAETAVAKARAHLQDVEDGCGCAEVWEHLSEQREE